MDSDNKNSQNSSVGILLIHGLSGMPNEMRPIARHLEKLG